MTADGTRMVAIGNFKLADGLLRDQVVQIDLTGAAASVATDWATSRYAPYCFNWAFDSYVRGVSFSPDGSYFVVNATGGGVTGTLCDAEVRWETNATGADVQPTWIDETGGDTVWAVTVTDSAVFVGGHQRWSNNPLGSDYARARSGAEARTAGARPDQRSASPVEPGRNPEGTAVYRDARHRRTGSTSGPTPTGSATSTTTGRRSPSSRTPAATPRPQRTPRTLPGTVYLADAKTTAATNVLYRINAGGSTLPSLDSGPDWAADNTDPSPYRNSDSNTASYDSSETVASTVPATTPKAVFESERTSPNDNPPMQWTFPVAAGAPIEVRLFFANRCSAPPRTSANGSSTSKLDGTTVLNHYDIVADVGNARGTMKAFDITSDGTVNIDFSRFVRDPLINGIEIVRKDIAAPPSNKHPERGCFQRDDRECGDRRQPGHRLQQLARRVPDRHPGVLRLYRRLPVLAADPAGRHPRRRHEDRPV